MNAIGRIRIYKGMLQKEVAKNAKMSLSAYRPYERENVNEIKFNKLMRIANALEVRTDDILNGRY
jgi:transcriptional regulator with XRE-family HTH domain